MPRRSPAGPSGSGGAFLCYRHVMIIGRMTVPVTLEAEVWVRIKGATTLHQLGTITTDKVDRGDPSEFLADLWEGVDEVAVAVQPMLTQEITLDVK